MCVCCNLSPPAPGAGESRGLCAASHGSKICVFSIIHTTRIISDQGSSSRSNRVVLFCRVGVHVHFPFSDRACTSKFTVIFLFKAHVITQKERNSCNTDVSPVTWPRCGWQFFPPFFETECLAVGSTAVEQNWSSGHLKRNIAPDSDKMERLSAAPRCWGIANLRSTVGGASYDRSPDRFFSYLVFFCHFPILEFFF